MKKGAFKGALFDSEPFNAPPHPTTAPVHCGAGSLA